MMGLPRTFKDFLDCYSTLSLRLVDVPEHDAICIREAVHGSLKGSTRGLLMVCVSFRLVGFVKGFEASPPLIIWVSFTPGLSCSSQGALVAEKDKAVSALDFEGSVDLSAIQSPGSFACFP